MSLLYESVNFITIIITIKSENEQDNRISSPNEQDSIANISKFFRLSPQLDELVCLVRRVLFFSPYFLLPVYRTCSDSVSGKGGDFVWGMGGTSFRVWGGCVTLYVNFLYVLHRGREFEAICTQIFRFTTEVTWEKFARLLGSLRQQEMMKMGKYFTIRVLGTKKNSEKCALQQC